MAQRQQPPNELHARAPLPLPLLSLFEQFAPAFELQGPLARRARLLGAGAFEHGLAEAPLFL